MILRRPLLILPLLAVLLALAPSGATAASPNVDALLLGATKSPVLSELRDVSDFDATRAADAEAGAPRHYDVLIVDGDRLGSGELGDVGMIQRFLDADGFVMVLDAIARDHAAIARYISFDLSAGAGGERSEMVMFGNSDAAGQDEMLIVNSGDLRPAGAADAPPAEVRDLEELTARRAAIAARDQIVADRTDTPVGAAARLARANPQLPEATTSCTGDKQLCDLSAQSTSFHVDNTPQFSAPLPNGYWWPQDFRQWNSRWPRPKTQEASWQSDEYFDVYLDNDTRPQGDNQVIVYRYYSTFNPARTNTFFHMDDVFSRPPFGSDRYYERAWWTGTIGVNAEPVPATEPNPAPPRSNPVGQNPSGVALGDFNGDKKQDIVATSRFGDKVSVLLNQGDGSFAPAVDAAVGTQPTGVATADFNGDGKQDVAVSNWQSNDVSVLLGTGTGSLRQQRRYPSGGCCVNAIQAGDVNKDGKPDVVVATQHNVAVLLNKGDGTFAEAKNFVTGGGVGSGVAIGDLNGDANPDLAVTFTNSGVTAMLGDGKGSFTPSTTLRTADGIGQEAKAVAIGDLNKDGKGDLVVGSSSDPDGLSILLGKGNGTFAAPLKARSSNAGTPGSYSVAITDADGDGTSDLAVANIHADTVAVLFGRGNGTFSRPLEFKAGRFPDALAAGDIVGASAVDLAVANQGSRDVTVLRKVGGQTRRDPVDVLQLGKYEPTTPNERATYSTGTDTTIGIQLSAPDAGGGLSANRTVTQSETTTIPSWSWESRADPASRSFRWLFSARTPCDARPTGEHGRCFEFSDGDGVSVKRPAQTSLDAIRTSAYGRWDARVAAPGQQPAYQPLAGSDGSLRFRLSSPITLIDSHCTFEGQLLCEPPGGWTPYVLNSAPHDYSIDPSVVNPCPDSDLRTCEPVFKPELFRCDKWEKKSGRAAECVNLGAKIGRGDAANGYEEEKVVGRITLAKKATDPNGVQVIVTSDRRNAQLQRGSNEGNLTRGTVTIDPGQKTGTFVLLTNDDEPIRCTGERSVTATIRAFYVRPADGAQLRVERPAGTCD
jgi:FG-GAP-like repeat